MRKCRPFVRSMSPKTFGFVVLCVLIGLASVTSVYAAYKDTAILDKLLVIPHDYNYVTIDHLELNSFKMMDASNEEIISYGSKMENFEELLDLLSEQGYLSFSDESTAKQFNVNCSLYASYDWLQMTEPELDDTGNYRVECASSAMHSSDIVDAEINSIVQAVHDRLANEGQPETKDRLLRAVIEEIASRYEYATDFTALSDKSKYDHSLAAGIQSGRFICSQYCKLAYFVLQRFGITSDIMSGEALVSAGTDSEEPVFGPHAWLRTDISDPNDDGPVYQYSDITAFRSCSAESKNTFAALSRSQLQTLYHVDRVENSRKKIRIQEELLCIRLREQAQ